MHRFELWAPLATAAEVKVNGSLHGMQRVGDRGWWEAEEVRLGRALTMDSRLTRVLRFTQTLDHGGSHPAYTVYRVSYDQTAFQWTDSSFESDAFTNGIIYELHVGTFSGDGTLDSAIEKLDDLVEMGITHVELMPIASFAGEYGWEYDGVALFSVHEPYGGPDALKRFVNAAHVKGLAVLLDVVYNHFGPVGNYAGKFLARI